MNILNSGRHIKQCVRINNSKTTFFQNVSTKFDLRGTKKAFLSTSLPQTKRSTAILAHLKCKSVVTKNINFSNFLRNEVFNSISACQQ